MPRTVRVTVGSITAPNRDALVLGTYDPDATTTGVLPGTTLTVRTTGQPVAGQTYQDIDWQMQVTPPTGTGTITMINCKFSGGVGGPPSTGAEGLVKLHNNGHCPVIFIDCTFRPQTLSHRWVGLHGHTFEAYRCDVSYCMDAFSVFNTHNAGGPILVTIEQCYVHDHVWYNNTIDPSGPGDGSHNDSAQLQGGTGGILRGNNLQGWNAPGMPNIYYGNAMQANATIMFKPDVSNMSGWVISDNLLSGGGVCTLNFAHDSPDRVMSATTLVATVHRNRFERDSSRGGVEVFRPTGPVVPNIDFGTGANVNVFTDNGATITISPGGSS